jgi:hypothetical protein
MVRYCGHCHVCGTKMHLVLDGEEWCPKCRQYRRYRSHGWAAHCGSDSPCPERRLSVIAGIDAYDEDE